MNAEQNEKLAKEIIKLLKEKKCWIDVSLYYNNKRVSSQGDGEIVVEDNIDVTKYIEYNNPEVITMTFEGPFYRAINVGKEWDDNRTYNRFKKIVEKYGYKIHPGYAWSLSLR
ncbi:hypothetical protein D3C81_333490 [compost metagenome]